jgi:RimJ/RimL family protein N-acetyltransferase
MKTGQILHRFVTRSGKEVIFRTPTWEDLDDLLELINSIIDEGAYIMVDERKTREEEVDWLSGVIARMEKGELIPVVTEVDGKAVASAEIGRGRFRCESHLGSLGIVVRSGYRDIGIGTELMRVLLEQARLMGLKIVTLSAFSTNGKAIHVYEKVGFVETGRIPKGLYKNGSYIDKVIMTKEIG